MMGNEQAKFRVDFGPNLDFQTGTAKNGGEMFFPKNQNSSLTRPDIEILIGYPLPRNLLKFTDLRGYGPNSSGYSAMVCQKFALQIDLKSSFSKEFLQKRSFRIIL